MKRSGEKREVIYGPVFACIVSLSILSNILLFSPQPPFTTHTILASRDMIIDLEGNYIDVTAKLAKGGWRKTYDIATSFFGVIDLLSILSPPDIPPAGGQQPSK